MFTALSDYLRLARAGAVMVRNDVVIPDAYRSRMPLAAKAAGGFLRVLPGGGGKGRPGQRFARALEKLGTGLDQAWPVHGDAAGRDRRRGGDRPFPP